jgi:hypothetical protein
LLATAELFGPRGKKLPLDALLISSHPEYNNQGDVVLRFHNFGGDRVRIADVRVDELPRPIPINSMIPGARPRDWTGEAVRPYKGSSRTYLNRGRSLTRKHGISLTVARMKDDRHVVQRVAAAD